MVSLRYFNSKKRYICGFVHVNEVDASFWLFFTSVNKTVSEWVCFICFSNISLTNNLRANKREVMKQVARKFLTESSLCF